MRGARFVTDPWLDGRHRLDTADTIHVAAIEPWRPVLRRPPQTRQGPALRGATRGAAKASLVTAAASRGVSCLDGASRRQSLPSTASSRRRRCSEPPVSSIYSCLRNRLLSLMP